MSNDIKLCCNCEFVSVPASRDIDKYKCFAPENNAGINLVTGEQQYMLAPKQLRLEGRENVCGRDGKWFKLRVFNPAADFVTVSDNERNASYKVKKAGLSEAEILANLGL